MDPRIVIIIVSLCVTVLRAQANDGYRPWLRYLDPRIIGIPKVSGYENLQIPLNVTITTDSGFEQCQPTRLQHCSDVDGIYLSHNGSLPECPEQNCFKTNCANEYRPIILLENNSIEYNLTLDNTVLTETVYPECGLNIDFQTGTLKFDQVTGIDSSNCSFSRVRPTIIVEHDNFTKGYTLSFTVYAPNIYATTDNQT